MITTKNWSCIGAVKISITKVIMKQEIMIKEDHVPKAMREQGIVHIGVFKSSLYFNVSQINANLDLNHHMGRNISMTDQTRVGPDQGATQDIAEVDQEKDLIPDTDQVAAKTILQNHQHQTESQQ